MKTLIFSILLIITTQAAQASLFECEINDKRFKKISVGLDYVTGDETGEISEDPNQHYANIKFSLETENEVFEYFQKMPVEDYFEYYEYSKTFYTDAFPMIANSAFGRIIIKVTGNHGQLSGLNFRRNPNRSHSRKSLEKSNRYSVTKRFDDLSCVWF